MRRVRLSLPGAIFRNRRRAFTFLELILAVALSVVLIRGMYTIFSAATSLTQMSEERMVGLLEVSAAFDYLSADFARIPSAGKMNLNTSGGQLQFNILGRNDEGEIAPVTYQLNGDSLIREHDGDSMVVAHNVLDFEAEPMNLTGPVRAVSIVLKFGRMTQHGGLGEQNYRLAFPVMSN